MKRYHDCLEVREDLSAYVDDELGADEKEGIEAHLGECTDCSRELEALKRVDDAYRGLETVGAPAGFEDDVRAGAEAGNGETSEREFRPAGWMGPAVALAAAAVVVIAGFVVLEVRQNGRMQTAAAPETAADAGQEAVLEQGTMPAEPGAAEDSAWDSFVRSTETPASPEGAAQADAATKPLSAEEVERLRALGYLNDEDASRKSTPQAETAPPPVAESPAREEMERDDISPNRAEVLGTPPAPEAEDSQEQAEEESRTLIAGGAGEDEPSAPEGVERQRGSFPIEQGEAVRRFTLRSFKVGADGVWYERGYADQPTVELGRDSDALRELMKQYPDEDWNKMLDRPARQVFQLDGVWYNLEAAPEA